MPWRCDRIPPARPEVRHRCPPIPPIPADIDRSHQPRSVLSGHHGSAGESCWTRPAQPHSTALGRRCFPPGRGTERRRLAEVCRDPFNPPGQLTGCTEANRGPRRSTAPKQFVAGGGPAPSPWFIDGAGIGCLGWSLRSRPPPRHSPSAAAPSGAGHRGSPSSSMGSRWTTPSATGLITRPSTCPTSSVPCRRWSPSWRPNWGGSHLPPLP